MDCTPQQAVDALNRFLAYDKAAVSAVFSARFKLTDEGARDAESDATLVPGCFNGKDGAAGLTIGPLGIINGLFGARIAAHYEGHAPVLGSILHFTLDPATPCIHPACVAAKAKE